MTDHGQLDQDPQIVAFSPELLKLADRRRQALEDCRQAAEDGDANAAVQMGVNCLYGVNGVEKDPKKAFYWFSQTAEDDPAGLYWRALCYDNGLGVDQDEDRACRLYQESAAHGYAPALCNLGVCYESGQGVEKDPAKAVELYRQAADQGYPMGRCNLGVMYFFGQGVEKDQKKAAYCFAQAAEQRLSRAQYLLGVCCEFGDGVERDVSRALALYREAADAGYPDAQCALGVLYRLGKGVAQDHREAARLFRQAAEGGCPRAWHFLGLSYDQGKGVERSEQEAFRCFLAAAQGDYTDALCQTGMCYYFGHGTEKDYDRAVSYFTPVRGAPADNGDRRCGPGRYAHPWCCRRKYSWDDISAGQWNCRPHRSPAHPFPRCPWCAAAPPAARSGPARPPFLQYPSISQCHPPCIELTLFRMMHRAYPLYGKYRVKSTSVVPFFAKYSCISPALSRIYMAGKGDGTWQWPGSGREW